MAEQAEIAFIKTFVNTISSQPVTYPDTYQQPPANSLKRVPVLPVAVPPPPASHRSSTPSPDSADAGASSSSKITLTIKSTKPAVTYTVDDIQPTDSILALKEMLRDKYQNGDGVNTPSAPPLEAMRLLLKGKALADQKLLKEYNVKDGDTINLMLKAGVEWDPTKPAPKPARIVSPQPVAAGEKMAASSMLETTGSRAGKKHQRIPSVVLSPSPSNDSPESEAQPRPDIMLDVDNLDTAASEPKEVSSYHTVISNPDFWDRLHSFLRTEFEIDVDTVTAFEEFLRASKGNLTASEIAKIRDQVGVTGMAGT